MTFKKINMVNIALTLMAVFTVSYSSEIDKRKIPQVTLGAVSSTAIITGWSLYFVGNYLQDKNTDLYENVPMRECNRYSIKELKQKNMEGPLDMDLALFLEYPCVEILH